MSWQRIELNMIPDTKVLPVVHASQFDSNRSISFQMFTGEDEWTIPEGLTIELHCRKVDDNIVTLAPLSVDGSVITFITTEQLTACSGQNKCELSFIDADDLVIGSLNFILDVEPDPLKGGLTSASSIYDLTQQIEDITQEVIGDDYYNKTETDALLADKADVSDLPDMSQYYTKTATDTLLNAKADKSDTYTKAQVDSALAAKANTADLATVATSGDYDDLINKPTIPAAQIQSDYAQADNTQVDYIKNKPDINAMIAAALLAVMPVETQTGNPCAFDTDIAAELQGLTCEIVASGGNGTPSTPIPIVGHSELNLVRCGKNLIRDEFVLGLPSTNIGDDYDTIITSTRYAYLNLPNVSGNVTVSITDYDANYIDWVILFGYTNGKLSGKHQINNFSGSTINLSGYDHLRLIIGAVSGYIVPSAISTVGKVQLELGSTATAYEPYNGDTFTVSFGQTVYGGLYDANRGKVKPNVYYPSYNGESITGRWLSSKDVYVEGNTPTTGAQVVCLDEYDTEIDVTELSVDTIVGVNNITSDCTGDVTASYKVSFQKYVDDQ